MYQMITRDGYITSIARGVSNGNITEEQYNVIKAKIDERPTAPDGFYYRLTVELEWELCELPEPSNTEEDE